MPITTTCSNSSCNRQLRVPDELLGRLVKCPSCGNTFTAASDGGAEESAPPPVAPPPPAPPEPPPSRRRDDDEPPPRRRARRDDYDDDEDDDYDDRPRRRRRRRDLTPHRGSLVLTFGILSLVVCAPMGIAAWIMGNNDLAEIRAGRMDPEGEGSTQAGRICGMIGTILMLLVCFGYGFILVIAMASGGMR